MEEFGKHLRFYRKQRRMTQTELASSVGVAPAYVSQIESALRMPSLKVAKRFADALRVDLPSLLGTPDQPPTSDRLSDSEKLELLRSLIRSVEFDLESRPHREESEPQPGAVGIRVSDGEDSVVRLYRYGEEPFRVDHLHAHPGEEVVYCAAGRLQVVMETEERTLAVGESFSFDSDLPHVILGEPGSVAVSTVTPPPTSGTVRRVPAGSIASNRVGAVGRARSGVTGPAVTADAG
jgi:transcriptional regulator with XRE-family HTH domain